MASTDLILIPETFSGCAYNAVYHIGFAKLYFAAYDKLSDMISPMPNGPRAITDRERLDEGQLRSDYRDLLHYEGNILSIAFKFVHTTVLLAQLSPSALGMSPENVPSQHIVAAELCGTLVGLLGVKYLPKAAKALAEGVKTKHRQVMEERKTAQATARVAAQAAAETAALNERYEVERRAKFVRDCEAERRAEFRRKWEAWPADWPEAMQQPGMQQRQPQAPSVTADQQQALQSLQYQAYLQRDNSPQAEPLATPPPSATQSRVPYCPLSAVSQAAQERMRGPRAPDAATDYSSESWDRDFDSDTMSSDSD